jgi:hypothetical protein
MVDPDKTWIDDVVVKYWTDWLVAHDIPIAKLPERDLRVWILRMEEIVGEEMQYAIPDEWHAMVENTFDDEDLGDLPHEHDEDD